MEKKVDEKLPDIDVHNICGHFSEKEIIWNIICLKPGHTILIEAKDNNEYDIYSNTDERYAKVIRSNTYFWRPLSEYI